MFDWVPLINELGVFMEIKVGGRKQPVREIDPVVLAGYIEKCGASISYSTSNSGGIHGSSVSGVKGRSVVKQTFLVKLWWPKNVDMKYGNMELLDSLSYEMGRTRRLERSINVHIPNRIEILHKSITSLDKKSSQYNRSLKCRKRKIKDEKLKLKEYKYELKYRKRLVYECSKSLIPAIYILRRTKYNKIQGKWRFMGKEQTRLHLGTIDAVGHLSDDELKRIAIVQIRKKFSHPLDTLTLKWIKDENKKANKWCERMGYKIFRD